LNEDARTHRPRKTLVPVTHSLADDDSPLPKEISFMNKLANLAKFRQLAKDQRGATIVEYVMLLIVILVFCVGAYRTLASKVSTSATTAAGSF
jgi:Flp pilus assembly pilin Flp